MVQGSGEESQTKLKAIKRKGRLRGRETMDFLSHRVFAGWLKKRGRWSRGSRGALGPEFRPPGYHRLYVITPQRSFTALRLACLPNPAGECTLIRLGAPNNGPCVPLSVVGGAEVTSRPHLINMDEMFQKGHKSSKRGRA